MTPALAFDARALNGESPRWSRRERRLFALAAAILLASVGRAGAEMAAADRYVVTPDELKKTFASKHPGPDWIIAHDDVFKLSAAQKGKLEAIEKSLDGRTNADAKNVEAAFATFTAAADAHPADEPTVLHDIEALSKAQIVATQTIIEAHLAAFAVLDAKQKAQFGDLVRCCAPPP